MSSPSGPILEKTFVEIRQPRPRPKGPSMNLKQCAHRKVISSQSPTKQFEHVQVTNLPRYTGFLDLRVARNINIRIGNWGIVVNAVSTSTCPGKAKQLPGHPFTLNLRKQNIRLPKVASWKSLSPFPLARRRNRRKLVET